MAGLLDWAASPEAMGLAQGLLSGNFAQGVANYGQIAERENAKRQALKDQQMQADEFAQFSQGLLADPQSAAAFALKSRNPQLQKFGMDQMMTQAAEKQKAAARQQMLQALQAAKTPQEALAAGVPDDLVKNYYESGRWGRVEGKVINDQLVDPYTGDTIGKPVPKQANPFNDLLISGPNGQLVPNKALIGVKDQLARAGAARTSVSVNMPDKKFYEGIGTGVADQVNSDFAAARGAVQTLNNANQIEAGLSKAITGPFADSRLTLAQIGQSLGVTGKSTTEQLQNTRAVMQGLARQELAAAASMKGQGQITESEREILRKAESGTISSMTKPEIQTFLSAIRKTGKARIKQHNENMQRLDVDPQAATLRNFMQVTEPEPFAGVQKAPLSGGWAIREK